MLAFEVINALSLLYIYHYQQELYFHRFLLLLLLLISTLSFQCKEISCKPGLFVIHLAFACLENYLSFGSE